MIISDINGHLNYRRLALTFAVNAVLNTDSIHILFGVVSRTRWSDSTERETVTVQSAGQRHKVIVNDPRRLRLGDVVMMICEPVETRKRLYFSAVFTVVLNEVRK